MLDEIVADKDGLHFLTYIRLESQTAVAQLLTQLQVRYAIGIVSAYLYAPEGWTNVFTQFDICDEPDAWNWCWNAVNNVGFSDASTLG